MPSVYISVLSTLQPRKRPRKILIELRPQAGDAGATSRDVLSRLTVATLKNHISAATGTSAEAIGLYNDGVLLPSSRMLSDCGITPTTILDAARQFDPSAPAEMSNTEVDTIPDALDASLSRSPSRRILPDEPPAHSRSFRESSARSTSVDHVATQSSAAADINANRAFGSSVAAPLACQSPHPHDPAFSPNPAPAASTPAGKPVFVPPGSYFASWSETESFVATGLSSNCGPVTRSFALGADAESSAALRRTTSTVGSPPRGVLGTESGVSLHSELSGAAELTQSPRIRAFTSQRTPAEGVSVQAQGVPPQRASQTSSKGPRRLCRVCGSDPDGDEQLNQSLSVLPHATGGTSRPSTATWMRLGSASVGFPMSQQPFSFFPGSSDPYSVPLGNYHRFTGVSPWQHPSISPQWPMPNYMQAPFMSCGSNTDAPVSATADHMPLGGMPSFPCQAAPGCALPAMRRGWGTWW